MKLSQVIIINAPPPTVFLWLDEFERQKQWIPSLIEEETLDQKPGKIGTKYRQVHLFNGKELVLLGETTVFRQDKALGGFFKSKETTMDVLYTLKSVGYAKTELTHNTEIKFLGFIKILSPVLNLLFARRSEAEMNQNLSALKTLAEQEYKDSLE